MHKKRDRPVEPHEYVTAVHVRLGEVGPHADSRPQQLNTMSSVDSQLANITNMASMHLHNTTTIKVTVVVVVVVVLECTD